MRRQDNLDRCEAKGFVRAATNRIMFVDRGELVEIIRARQRLTVTAPQTERARQFLARNAGTTLGSSLMRMPA